MSLVFFRATLYAAAARIRSAASAKSLAVLATNPLEPIAVFEALAIPAPARSPCPRPREDELGCSQGAVEDSE